MSHPLYPVQQVRRLRGGSQAQLLRASDGAYCVTKSAQNPQHVRVLANASRGSLRDSANLNYRSFLGIQFLIMNSADPLNTDFTS